MQLLILVEVDTYALTQGQPDRTRIHAQSTQRLLLEMLFVHLVHLENGVLWALQSRSIAPLALIATVLIFSLPNVLRVVMAKQ